MRVLLGCLLFATAIFAPVVAKADDPSTTLPGASLTSLGARLSLQCVTRFEDSDSSGRHAPAIADVDLRKKIPDYDKAGFKMTGGGCEQYFGTIPPGMIPGYVIRNAPIGDASWSCNISDQPGWPDQPDGGPTHRARAHATACRVVVDYEPVDPPSSITTNDGNDIIVARRGVAFLKPLKYDYRLCNTDKSGSLNVLWTDYDNNPQSQPPKTPFRSLDKPLAPGACVEFGNVDPQKRATSIRLSATTQIVQTVQFARYPGGTFAAAGRAEFFPIGVTPTPAPHPGNASKKVVVCKAAPRNTKPQKPGDVIFVQQCRLEISNWGHYRICFDDKYVETRSGEMKTWPAAEMPIVLDKALISVPSPSNSEDPRRNFVFPAGCRDYYDVQEAFVLVGRIVGDHNFDPGQTWDPAQVAKIHMWVAGIK